MSGNDVWGGRHTRRTVLRRAGGGLAALGAGSAFLAACGGSSSGGGSSGGGGGGKLNAWWWGDPENMQGWLETSIKTFKTTPGGADVSVAMQQTETLNSAFAAAAAAKHGPDIAAQWATQPVLARVWVDAVHPLDDVVAADELAHWVFRQENQYGGKTWAAPVYIIGQPFCYNKKLFTQAGLDPEKPPATWDELLSACKTLKAKGITPLSIGNKDTFGGRWAWSFLAMQTLDSPEDLKAPLLGQASFGDEKYSMWAERWKELIDAGYYNDDAMSLDSQGGADVFKAGKAAMSWSVENNVVDWGATLGDENVAPLPYFPTFADGTLAKAYTATQSTSYFVTAWTKDPKVCAAFLQFLHEPAQQKSLYDVCKVVPADDRFDRSVITNPLRKALADKAATGLQVWLENWIPPSLDDNANGPGGQKLMTGGSVKEVAALWDQQAKAWREQNPDVAKKFEAWQMTPVSI
jgi:raffinose/stachyose/melibiose transport system substrate-binding protein